MNYLDKPELARLTNEIHFFNEQGIKVSIEVGKRLEEAKPEFSNADEWMQWAESEFGYKKSQAYKLVAIAKRFHSSGISVEGKTINELYALAAFDDDDLQEPKQTSNGEEKKLIDMSSAEIEQYKRDKADAERRAQVAEKKAEQAVAIAESLDKDLKHTKSRLNSELNRPLPQPQTIEKPPADYNEAKAKAARLEQVEQELIAARNLAEQYKKDSGELKEMKGKIEFLHREKNDLHRQIDSATALSGLSVEIDNLLKTKLAPVRYSRALERLDSEVAVRNLTEIIESVEHWCEDMRRYVPKNNRKVVIDYDPAG